MLKLKRNIKVWLVVILVVVALSVYRLPYYVSYPGMAKELSPIIEVEGGYEEEGNFMLTTIRMGEANVVQYVVAKFSDYQKLYPRDVIRPEGVSDEEYANRQLHMMETSQEAATVVAYEHADKEIDIEYNGVFVMGVVEGMPAEDAMKPGDRIHSIDGNEIATSEELIDYVSDKKSGDEVKVTFEREGETKEVSVALAEFPQEKEKVGLGISLVTDRTVDVNPEVTIDTDEIGGPSAGLMFSIEIYNQLTEEDLTKGYQIAGTGTIDYEGVVGPIGGIKQKVVAADNAGAEIFFAPNENGAEDSNYQHALEAAEDIGTEMRIVPVDTFEDALEFLETLGDKK